MCFKYVLCILIFLVSFAFAQGLLNDNHYVKQFTFQLVFLVVGIVSITKNKLNCGIVLNISWADLFILLLSVFYIYFYIGTNNDLDYFLPIIYLLFYYFIRIQTLGETNDLIKILTNIIPVIILLHIVVCLLQYVNIISGFHSFFCVGSTFGNPDMLGAYLAVLLPFCYIRETQKIFGYSLLVICIILLILLQARTAIFTVMLTGFVYLILSRKILKKHVFFIAFFTIIVIVGLICLHPSSVSGRVFIWIISFLMIISKPQGWGLYAYQKHYLEFQSDFISNHSRIVDFFNVDVVHSSFNEFLNIGVTLGIGAVVCYGLFTIYILALAYRKRSLLFFPLLAFQIVSLTYFPLRIVPLAVVFVLLVAITLNLNSRYSIRIKCTKSVTAIIIGITFFLSYSNWQAYRGWQLAVNYAQDEKTYKVSSELYAKMYPSLRGNGRFLISRADLQYRMKDTLAASSSMKQAENYFSDILFFQNLALLYELEGNICEAKNKLHTAVNMVPEQYNVAYQQILFLQRIGEETEAYSLAVKLYERPIKESSYIDSKIIRLRIKAFIQSYRERNELLPRDKRSKESFPKSS